MFLGITLSNKIFIFFSAFVAYILPNNNILVLGYNTHEESANRTSIALWNQISQRALDIFPHVNFNTCIETYQDVTHDAVCLGTNFLQIPCHSGPPTPRVSPLVSLEINLMFP